MAIVFKIERKENGLAYGKLQWNEMGLESGAVSGPHGNADLPDGLYMAPRSGLIDKNGESPFCDSLRNCWFQFLQPQFSTSRTELAIHPDGNVSGTAGCIGILDSNTKPWYEAFKSLAPSSSTSVEVIDLT